MANRFDLINLTNTLQTTSNGTVANVNFDSNTLFVDSVNNRVGIGTSAPTDSIQVAGNAVIANNLSFNSGYGSAAVAYGCRAWANFDGSAATLTVRASGNISSITDHGVGDYTVNFTSAMPDANYSAVVTGSGPVNTAHTLPFLWTIRNTYSTSAFSVGWFLTTNSTVRADPIYGTLAVFR